MGNIAAFITKSLKRSNVSLCLRSIGGVRAPARVGMPISREAASLQVGRQKSCEAATLLLAEPSACGTSPIRALRAAEVDIATSRQPQQ